MTYICPICGGRTLQSDRGYFCFPCQKLVPVETKQPRATPTKPAQTGQPAETYRNEPELVTAICAALKAAGVKYKRIGQRVVKDSGSDAGVPDLMWWLPKSGFYPARVGFLEAKVRPNSPTPEQQELIDDGVSVAVYSVKEALEALGERS